MCRAWRPRLQEKERLDTAVIATAVNASPQHLFHHIMPVRPCSDSVAKPTLRHLHSQQVAELDLRDVVGDVFLLRVSAWCLRRVQER